MALLVAIKGWSADDWVSRFRRTLDGLPVVDAREPFDPAAILYAAVWKPEPGLLAGLPNLKAIFNLGAGVDALLADPTLPDVPVVRTVDEDLTRRMTEYVVLHVLLHHRRMSVYATAQQNRVWLNLTQPGAESVRVGILGFGHLGRAAAEMLLRLGFRVAGWSRRGEPMDGVEVFAGSDGLKPFLARTDILVALLPLTPDTAGILDLDLFRGLAKDGPLGGAILINAGRGGLQVADDILVALDEGSLAGASLDVFEEEPLPPESPLWAHPQIWLTPHNAADSDPEPICTAIVAQIGRHRAGEPLDHVVDRRLGY
jgi:glyoxylate/hydroxypyruvate reductase A